MKCIGVQVPSECLQNDMRAETYVRAVNFADKMGFRLETADEFLAASELYALLEQQEYHAKQIDILEAKLTKEKSAAVRLQRILDMRVEALIARQNARG